MGPQAGHRVGRWRGERCPFLVQLERDDVHALQPMALHRGAHLPRHGAQVLPHQLRAVPVRLEAERRVQLARRIAHVDPLGRAEAAGDPVQAVEPHHVIQPKHSGDAHHMAQARDPVRVALLPVALRMQRREPPILAGGEEGVWGRPGRGVGE